MTQGLPNQLEAPTVIVGVDTHKHRHVAVAIESRGMRLGDHAFDADSEGYRALVAWAETYGAIEAFGIEGTGGYGVGLSRTVRRAGHRVVEVNRADRRLRRAAGKSDTIDAEAAARAVLAGQATATPKAADGAVEMMRQLKVTRDTAVKARTTAMIALKQILVNASPVLRESCSTLPDRALVTRSCTTDSTPGQRRSTTPVASSASTRSGSLARRPAAPSRSRPRDALCTTATGPAPHARRVRQARAPVTGPSLARPRRRNRPA